ncbi:MAG: DUF1844 domain-containing protein [Planctomycetes bacterium]|nr:DUF1844 domain-containing protein [Planctomycetota bacterium]
MTQDDSAPKLQIDSDWKAQAQAEKAKLLEQEKAKAEQQSGEDAQKPGKLPQADFKSLMGVLASQAIMGLGAMNDPKTGRVVIDLDGARFSIDLLGVLEEKTKGNLSDEQSKEITQILAELRSRFVQITQLVAQQQAGGMSAEEPIGGPEIPLEG